MAAGVDRGRLRHRADHACAVRGGGLPETPTEAEAAFLDSSHIISGPLTGRTPDAHPRTAPGEPPPDAAAHRDTP
jgi:hypothetical protein